MKCIIFSIVIISALSIYPQKFGTGLLLDPKLYENSPKSAPLTRETFFNLPLRFSIKRYAPKPGNQGLNATCAGWACAYGARTILSAISENWSGDVIDSNAFSPSFIYNQIRKEKNCSAGVSLIDALETLKLKGALKIRRFGINCEKDINRSDEINAKFNRILEYRELFDFRSKNKVLTVKKSLNELKPVVVAMECPSSFESVGVLWKPDSSDYSLSGRGHALVVVSYDDSLYGGAFELMNSWGTNWGENGFVWIKYSDFDHFFKYGFELIDRKTSHYTSNRLSGKLLFSLSNGKIMNVKFNGKYFEMLEAYPSGTKFELQLSNEQPAYVYAFGSDKFSNTFKLFPYSKNMSPLLPYKNSKIILPDEKSFIALDSIKTTSYLFFIYSGHSIDIDSLIQKFKNLNGSAWEKYNLILRGKSIPANEINYNVNNYIQFDATLNKGYIIPILVSIRHL